jgi:hypothetical protein
MSTLLLLLLGLAAGFCYGVVIFIAMFLFGPLARAPRIAFAGMIGGSITFFLTALILGPFYPGAATLSALAEPMGVAAVAGAGAAIMGAMLMLRTPRV